jgi:hypothetical protein
MASFIGCRAKEKLSVRALEVHLRNGYEGYLREGGKPVDGEINARELVEKLSGKNEIGIAFVEFPKSFLDKDGYVVDTWKMRLRIEAVNDPAGQIAIRSAGADRIFGTLDDVCVVSGRRGE